MSFVVLLGTGAFLGLVVLTVVVLAALLFERPADPGSHGDDPVRGDSADEDPALAQSIRDAPSGEEPART